MSEASYREPNDTTSKDSYHFINIEVTPNKVVRVHCVNHYQKAAPDDETWHESAVIHIPIEEFTAMLEKLGIVNNIEKLAKEVIDY